MDRGWGGLPIMFPSKTAMDYLWHRTDILPEEDIAPGAHYRARRAMLDNVSLLTKYVHTEYIIRTHSYFNRALAGIDWSHT